MKRMTLAAWLLMMAVVLGAPAAMADEVRAEATPADDEVAGLTPLFASGSVGCNLNCVDVWELKCTSSRFIEIFEIHDVFCPEDTFLGTIVGLAPTSLYGKSDSATNSGCSDGFVSLIKPSGDAALKALFTITTLPGSSAFRDYSLEFHCHNAAGAFKNGSIVLKSNQ